MRTAEILTVTCFVLGAGQASADVTPHATMLRQPDVSRTQIVFSYANDLWLVPRSGGVASPLASPPGAESFPRFSPDGKTIAFVGSYDGGQDIYTLAVAGGVPRRVTHHPAAESLNGWAPDGRLIYHAGGVAGLGRMSKLFTVGAEGGLPEPLPVPYGTMGAINADGTWLAYTPHSRHNRTWKRYRGGMATDIWLFNLKDFTSNRITDWEGTDEQPMWHGNKVYYMSDAGPAHRLNIWVYDTGSGQREQITTFADFDCKFPSMGPGPNGNGEIVVQNGESLYLIELPGGPAKEVEVAIPGDRPKLRPRRVDVSRDIADVGISSTGKRAVIEARGDIWTSPAENGSPRNLTRTDGAAERSPAWSPDGRWIAYFSDATGEYELYITQSDGKGETKQLTDDAGPFKFNPVWSPDSKRITFSDKTGALYLHTLTTEEEAGSTVLVDTDPWANQLSPSWSHDSRWITYAKQPQENGPSAIWVYNTETSVATRLTSGMFVDTSPVFDRKGEYLYFVSSRSFSPTYSDIDETFVYRDSQILLAVPLRDDIESPWAAKSDEEEWKEDKAEKENGEEKDEEKAGEADDGDKGGKGQADDEKGGQEEAAAPDDVVSGTWEGTATGPDLPPEGLPFTLTLSLAQDNSVTGNLNAGPYSGPVTGTYDPATGDLNLTMSIESSTVVISLKIEDGNLSGTASADGQTYTVQGSRTATGTGEDEEEGEEKPAEKVEIDLVGFEGRALPLPVSPGRFASLAVNDKNQLLYTRLGRDGGIKLFDLEDKKKEEKTVSGSAVGFDISADGKKILLARGGAGAIQNAAPGATAENVVTEGMAAMIDPRAEWKQIFTDAWRIQRDFFYDPNMHGVDWRAVFAHYLPMIDDCNSREDVNFVIGEMISELNVGHAYLWGGDLENGPGTNVGMLGCDFELAKTDQGPAVRISRIYEGAPWDSDARGPLSQPGVEVSEGDYLLAVDGLALDTAADPWAAFIGKAGRVVALTVSDKPVIDDHSREVLVEPLRSDATLRYRAWIEQNRRYVQEKTSGRVGYIYVPDTGLNGQNDLFRQFFGQVAADALIIDERWNGGGQIPTRFIELLNRPIVSYWARRDGNDWPWPPDSHQGPKCMLINGLAGSGGDMFPWLFRFNKLGKLIGTRTWGGLVGISGNPPLIDGGYTSVPTFGFYEIDGTWGIEGHGVDPDIEVIDDPALMVDGGDPQLDAAIAHMLEELEKHPYVPPERPPYPDRSGMGIQETDK